jgi:aminoglycoside/choline kinase family phosphotransferase
MPTILETRYMEQMPRLIRELTNEVFALREEVAKLKETIASKE